VRERERKKLDLARFLFSDLKKNIVQNCTNEKEKDRIIAD
jgi:hypothetical protein